jgi:hypothetical protein
VAEKRTAVEFLVAGGLSPRSDNGAEFVATAAQMWLAQCGVQTVYIDPGKPWQNGKDERSGSAYCNSHSTPMARR